MKVVSLTMDELTASAYVLMNTELGAERGLAEKMRNIPNAAEVHLVYGIYDILVKLEADSTEKLKETITNHLRSLEKVRTTLTMMVVSQS